MNSFKEIVFEQTSSTLESQYVSALTSAHQRLKVGPPAAGESDFNHTVSYAHQNSSSRISLALSVFRFRNSDRFGCSHLLISKLVLVGLRKPRDQESLFWKFQQVFADSGFSRIPVV